MPDWLPEFPGQWQEVSAVPVPNGGQVTELAEMWHHVAEHVDRAAAKLRKPVNDRPARIRGSIE